MTPGRQREQTVARSVAASVQQGLWLLISTVVVSGALWVLHFVAGTAAVAGTWVVLILFSYTVKQLMVVTYANKLRRHERDHGIEDLIGQLSGEADIRIETVVVSDGLERRRKNPSARRNAAWLSTGRRRGILIIGEDILRERAVTRGAVAHELGHGHHNHQRTRTRVALASRIAQAVVALVALNYSFLVLWGCLLAERVVRKFVVRWVSRHHENQADLFAAALVGVGDVESTLEFFEAQGIGFDRPGFSDNLFSTHPFTPDRITAIRKIQSRRSQSRRSQ